MALPVQVGRVQDPMNELQREMDNMLNRWFGGVPQRADGRRSAPYAVDVREDNDHLYFDVELPGFRKEEVDLTLEDQTLTITAERNEESRQEKKGELLLNERRHTYFSRSFRLPPSVSMEDCDATLKEGVLHITLNKREETKPRKVQVK